MEIKKRIEIYFELVEDPRNKSYVRYKLSDILFLLLCGLICGCNDLEEVIEFGEERGAFFKENSSLTQMPCLMTLTNVLKIIKPERPELCLYGILRNVFEQNLKPIERQICIDGKTICSTAVMKEYEQPIHIITGLLADNSVSLEKITVESKTNEIPAVRELLDLMDIKGTVVTMDAMHCQKDTMAKIIENKGDYVVQLKRNQGRFYEDVYTMFDDKYMDENDNDSEYGIFQTLEKSHGRIEQRTCYVLKDIEYFTDYLATWSGL